MTDFFLIIMLKMSILLDIDFVIKLNAKRLKCFDLSEVIFKFMYVCMYVCMYD